MNDEQPTQPLTEAELAAIRTRFDNRNEDMRSWGPVTLFHAAREVPRLLAEVDRLRAENHVQASKLAHFESQHQPVTVDWSASPKCKTSHGPSWVNWPCSDAFVLGMTEHSKAPNQ